MIVMIFNLIKKILTLHVLLAVDETYVSWDDGNVLLSRE